MSVSAAELYRRAGAWSLALRGAGVPLGLASLALLTRILPRAEFGLFAVASVVVAILGGVAAGGVDRSLLFRSSRLDAPPGELAGRTLAATALGRGLAGGVLTAALLALLAGPVASLFGQPGLAAWLRLLAALVPLHAALRVYGAWQRGRQRIVEAGLVSEGLPALATAAALALVWALWPTREGVALAHAAALGGVALLAAARAPLRPRLRGPLAPADVLYGLRLMASELLARAAKHADLLVLVALSTATAAAEFRVATRVAALVLVAHQILGGVLSPRVGHLMASGERRRLEGEYARARRVALLGALAVGGAVAAGGPLALRALGGFEDAQPLLLVLVAAYIVPVAFGMTGNYLSMAGHARWTLSVQAFSLVASFGLVALLVPALGSLGAAIGTGLALLGTNLLASWLAWRLERFPTLSPEASASAGLAVVVLALAAAGVLPGPASAALLAAAALPLAARSAGALRRPEPSP